jgi:hypothetical protein
LCGSCGHGAAPDDMGQGPVRERSPILCAMRADFRASRRTYQAGGVSTMSRAPRHHAPVSIRKAPRPHRILLAGAAAAIGLVMGPGLATAETALTIYSDQARVLPVNGTPATAIVGNPMYADASIRQGMIVLQGRHFGTTNIVVLDAGGNELANFVVTVQQTPQSRVTVFKAGGAVTYTCADNCETTLEVGDETEHFKVVQTEMAAKYGMAIGETQASK